MNLPERSLVKSATRYTLVLDDGSKVLDASCGPAVTCLGHSGRDIDEVFDAMSLKDQPFYVSSGSFVTEDEKNFKKALLDTTDGVMKACQVFNSGSEANEGMMKLARQYFCEIGEDQRTKFITRHDSYHGATLGALSLSGHPQRRTMFEDMLLGNVSHVSSCNPYWDCKNDQTEEEYVQQKALELDAKFKELGPDRVIAFVVETVVGAALGCVPAVPGYLKAMKDICDKYGALLIFDEVMCGTGRTGTMHAWQHYGVPPDIQTMGKGLGAGVLPISALLYNQRVVDALQRGSGSFAHGHTYQNHAVICRVGHAVLRIVQGLLENIIRQGQLLNKLLHEKLESHPNVGNIRGRGLFSGVEFVKDKKRKLPFDADKKVSQRIHLKALEEHKIYFYPGTGNYIIIAPQFNSTEEHIRLIVKGFKNVVTEIFEEIVRSESISSRRICAAH